jgi:glucose/arabinose dehydrogenase
MEAQMRAFLRFAALSAAALTLACSGGEKVPEGATFGANPQLPEPESAFFPTVNIAAAVGWPTGRTPIAAPGFAVVPFASGLDHPRWLYVLPNGDVLVAESNKPPQADPGGVENWFLGVFQSKAGAGEPSPNRVILLRDANRDGIAETRSTFLENLSSPFGMTLVDNDLYVANTDALMRFPYKAGETRITSAGTKVIDLPSKPLNHHWTKNVIANTDGSKLYVATGSNSNVAENGMEVEKNRAEIIEVDPRTGRSRVFATGLRNPVGMDWEPRTGALWTAVNERDELGDDLVPDYMTSVKDGGFYGWPYSYFGQHVDTRVQPQRPDLVKTATVPDYALGAHTASLGLTFNDVKAFSPKYHGGAFVGQHGSWNRSEPAGYKVIFIPFKNGSPSGPPEDILTGFLDEQGGAQGRPVGVAFDHSGGLLVADDVGNVIWRVTANNRGVASVSE